MTIEVGPCRNQSPLTELELVSSTSASMVGRAPLVENIASLINPPASPLSEGHWLSAVIQGGESRMLVDLHNMYERIQFWI